MRKGRRTTEWEVSVESGGDPYNWGTHKETKRHLDTIRKLRNRFGHAEKKIDFDDPEAVACCRSLARLVGEEPKTAQERRNVYVHAVRLLIANLPSVINPEATP